MFPFEAGGSFIEGDRKKALYGKYNICLNLLGNFTSVHREWKEQGYSGWSSGLEIASVLHQTQTVIIENLENANLHQIESVLKEAAKFEAEHKEVMDEIKIYYPEKILSVNLQTSRNPYLCRLQKLSVTVHRPPLRPPSVIEKKLPSVSGGGKKVAISTTSTNTTTATTATATTAVSSSSHSSVVDSTSCSLMSSDDLVDISDLKIPSNIKLLCKEFLSKLPNQNLCKDFKSIIKQFVVAEEIQCWILKTSYVDTILGYGIRLDKKKKKYELNTDGRLISIPAFCSLANTRSVTKAENFKYFLPAWINGDHAKNPSWLEKTKETLESIWIQIGTTNQNKRQVPQHQDETMALCNFVESIYARLINTLIVQCAKASETERHTCEVIVHCIINLWRTMYFFMHEYEPTKSPLTNSLGTEVDEFIIDEQRRSKSWCPDIGIFLIQSTPFLKSRERWCKFLDACENESALRRCRWLQEKGVKLELKDTYKHTEVGRQNIVFQIMLKNIVITMDVDKISAEMDQSNCQLPEKVTSLMTEWNKVREIVFSTESGWKDYYDQLHKYGLSETLHTQITESDETILKYLQDNDDKSKRLKGSYMWDPNLTKIRSRDRSTASADSANNFDNFRNGNYRNGHSNNSNSNSNSRNSGQRNHHMYNNHNNITGSRGGGGGGRSRGGRSNDRQPHINSPAHY